MTFGEPQTLLNQYLRIPADSITLFILVSLSVVTPFFPPRNGSDLHAMLQLDVNV